VIRGYENVERFFTGGNPYIAGENITLADFSVWTSLLVLDLLIPIDAEKFPKLKSYLKRLESHKTYRMNQDGALKQVDFIEKCMEKAKNYKINTFELVYPKPI
jgi:glutathione S-transferase